MRSWGGSAAPAMVAAPGRGEYRRVTAAAAEAVGVMVAAIENPIVVVPSGQRAALRLAQGEASAVTEAVRMVIAAVSHAVMGVPVSYTHLTLPTNSA